MTAANDPTRRPERSGGPGRARALAKRLQLTPLHPQWFAFVREARNLRETCEGLTGIVLDIGCADGKPRRYLSSEASYVGLDYYSTAASWYGTRPDLYADARRLPLRDDSVDHVLLLDVLEHIPDPELCLAEIGRTLKRGCRMTVQVPFLYPIHDAPLDFHRWTRFGLERAAARHGFAVETANAIGHPLETAALNANIACSKTVLNWMRAGNPLAVLVVALPILVLVANCAAWLMARLSRADDLMPYAYRMVWVRT